MIELIITFVGFSCLVAIGWILGRWTAVDDISRSLDNAFIAGAESQQRIDEARRELAASVAAAKRELMRRVAEDVSCN